MIILHREVAVQVLIDVNGGCCFQPLISWRSCRMTYQVDSNLALVLKWFELAC